MYWYRNGRHGSGRSWIYNYPYNQCPSPLTLWVRIPLRRDILDTTLCQWLAASQWFSPGTPVSSTFKADRHDITEILLKVALSTITLPPCNKRVVINSNGWLYQTIATNMLDCCIMRNLTNYKSIIPGFIVIKLQSMSVYSYLKKQPIGILYLNKYFVLIRQFCSMSTNIWNSVGFVTARPDIVHIYL